MDHTCFTPSHLPGTLPTEKKEKNCKKNATTRKKLGKTPKKSGANDSQENADRRRREETSRNQRRNGAGRNLGQTGRCVVSLGTVFPARYSSFWTVVRPALWLVHGSLAVCKAHWPSSLDDDVCVTSESPCATSALLREHSSQMLSKSPCFGI